MENYYKTSQLSLCEVIKLESYLMRSSMFKFLVSMVN